MNHGGLERFGLGVAWCELTAHIQALIVLGYFKPFSDRYLVAPVVEEHSHGAGLGFQSLGEGAGLDDVAIAIDHTKNAGITFENALGASVGELDCGLIEGQGFANAWHLLPPERSNPTLSGVWVTELGDRHVL
ncbi:hypothetical protein D3C79_502530 [compost metagenome]